MGLGAGQPVGEPARPLSQVGGEESRLPISPQAGPPGIPFSPGGGLTRSTVMHELELDREMLGGDGAVSTDDQPRLAVGCLDRFRRRPVTQGHRRRRFHGKRRRKVVRSQERRVLGPRPEKGLRIGRGEFEGETVGTKSLPPGSQAFSANPQGSEHGDRTAVP